MGVPFSARFVLFACMCVCMCVFLFPDSILSSLQINSSRCFALLTSCFDVHGDMFKCKWCQKCEVIFFSRDCDGCSKNRPHEHQTQLSVTQPRLHKACISSTQRRCLLSEVTARPETPTPQLNDHLIWLVSFFHPPLFLYFSSLSLCLFVCLHWNKETYVPVQRDTH